MSLLQLCDSHPTLLAFTSDQCIFCKTLQPALDALHKSKNDQHKRFDALQFDVKLHSDLFREFGVSGFPTLLVFDPKSQKFWEYNNERTSGAMAACALDKVDCRGAEWNTHAAYALVPHDVAAAANPSSTFSSNQHVDDAFLIRQEAHRLAQEQAKRLDDVSALHSKSVVHHHQGVQHPSKLQNGDIKEAMIALCNAQPTLVIFSGKEWCGHCKIAQPLIETLPSIGHDATHIVQYDLPLQLASENTFGVFSAFGIEGYPTFLYFDPKVSTSEFEHVRSDQLRTIMTDNAKKQNNQEVESTPRVKKMWEQTKTPEIFLTDCQCEWHNPVKKQAGDNYGDFGDGRGWNCTTFQNNHNRNITNLSEQSDDKKLFASCNDMSHVPDQHVLIIPLDQKKDTDNDEEELLTTHLLELLNFKSRTKSVAVEPFGNVTSAIRTSSLLQEKQPQQNLPFSHQQQVAKEACLELEMCQNCPTFLAFTGQWCVPCAPLLNCLKELRPQEGCEMGFHCLEFSSGHPVSETHGDHIRCAFDIYNLPAVVVFSPQRLRFMDYCGLMDSKSFLACSEEVCTPRSAPKNVAIKLRSLQPEQLKQQQQLTFASSSPPPSSSITPLPNVVSRIQLCKNCPSVLIFALRTDSYKHLVEHDGKDIHVQVIDPEVNSDVVAAFAVHNFPLILVFDPTVNAFYVYDGDVSNIDFIKWSSRARVLHKRWMTVPQVLFVDGGNHE